MPHPRGSNQIRVISERSHHQFCLLCGNKTAASSDHLANAIHEQRRAFHHAAAEDDRIRSEQSDEIRQSQAEIVALMLYGLLCEFVSLLSEFSDPFCCDSLPVQISSRGVPFHPRDQRWPCSQRFPASAKATGTIGAGWIENLMTDLGMGSIHSTVKVPVKNDAAADSGTDCHIDQSGAILAGSPTGLS